jgi:hypothetical protein
MVDIVCCAAAHAAMATVTDEQFDELLALALSWQAYCVARRELNHRRAVQALAQASEAGSCTPATPATSANLA